MRATRASYAVLSLMIAGLLIAGSILGGANAVALHPNAPHAPVDRPAVEGQFSPRVATAYPVALTLATTPIVSPNAPKVRPLGVTANQSTLDLLNGTLLPGNFPVVDGVGPTELVPNTISGEIAVGSIYSGTVLELDTSTNAVRDGVALGGYIEGFAFDAPADAYFVVSGDNVTKIAADTSAILGSVPLGGPITGLAVDTANGEVFATVSDENAVVAVDPSNLSIVATIGVPGGPQGIVYDGASQMMAVVDTTTNEVSFINGGSYAVVKNVTGGSEPRGIYFEAAAGLVLVTDIGANTVQFENASNGDPITSLAVPNCEVPSVTDYPPTGDLFLACEIGNSIVAVDPHNQSIVKTVNVPGAYSIPSSAFDAADGLLYFGNVSTNGVDLLNGTTYAWVKHIGTAITPDGIYADPQTGTVYVAGQGSNNLSVISSSTHRVTATVATALDPSAEAWDAANQLLYVVGGCASGVAVVSASTQAVVRCDPVPSANLKGVAYDPANGDLYVTSLGSDVYVVDAATGALVSTIAVSGSTNQAAPYSVAFDPRSGYLFVTNWDWNNVTVINTTTNAIVGWDGVGLSPTGICYDPYTDQFLVVDGGGSYLSQISGTSGANAGSFHVGGSPEAAAVDPDTDQLFVSFSNSGNLSVWNATSYAYETSIPVGITPDSISFDGNGSLVVTTSWNQGNATIIAAPTLTVLGTVAVGGRPLSDLWDPLDGDMVIGNGYSEYAVGGTLGGGTLSFVHLSEIPGPSVISFAASPASLMLGNSTTLQLLASPGNGSLSYTYLGLPNGCTTQNTSTLSCTPTDGGRFSITGVVRDARGNSAQASVVLTVGVRIDVSSVQALRTTLDAGQDLSLVVTASGGVGTLTYSYQGLPGGCASRDAASFSCVAEGQGKFSIAVSVADTLGDAAGGHVNVTVLSPVAISYFYATPANITLGNTTTLSVLASGGSGVFSYWFSELPAGCASANETAVTCRPTSTGTFTISATVNDSLGGTAHEIVNLTVRSPQPPNSSSGGASTGWFSGWVEYVSLALGAVAVVAILALLVRRRRSQPPTGTPPTPPGNTDSEPRAA